MKEKIEKISTQIFVMFAEISECIKEAKDEKSRQKVRSLLNALASYQKELEDYYKHPDRINEVECR